MLGEATSIAIYKMCARSVQNRLQIVNYYQSSSSSSSSSSSALLTAAEIEASFLNSIDGCTILLDFFDVDFPRTTATGAKANRGYMEGIAFAGWTHILASFSMLLTVQPLVDKIASNQSLQERFRRILEQVASFWDSPLCKLLTFESYTGSLTFEFYDVDVTHSITSTNIPCIMFECRTLLHSNEPFYTLTKLGT